MMKKTWLTAQPRHYHNFLLLDGYKITVDRYRGKGDIRTLKKWTPHSLVYKTIASRKHHWKDTQGKQSDMRLTGGMGWIDTYFPEQYDIWDTYTRHELQPETKPTYIFTIDEDF
ncbi:hypothetical protein GCM10027190_50750 [Spirosoma areae]